MFKFYLISKEKYNKNKRRVLQLPCYVKKKIFECAEKDAKKYDKPLWLGTKVLLTEDFIVKLLAEAVSTVKKNIWFHTLTIPSTIWHTTQNLYTVQSKESVSSSVLQLTFIKGVVKNNDSGSIPKNETVRVYRPIFIKLQPTNEQNSIIKLKFRN